MKRTAYLSIFILFILAGCGPKYTPDEYNKIIIDEQVKIARGMLDMANEFKAFDFDKAENVRSQLVRQCDSSIKIVSALPDYNGNTKLRDAAVALFTYYSDISQNEYKEMVDIFKNGKEQGIDNERLQEIQRNCIEREMPLDKAFQTAQKEFARENGMSLNENKIQDEINNLGK